MLCKMTENMGNRRILLFLSVIAFLTAVFLISQAFSLPASHLPLPPTIPSTPTPADTLGETTQAEFLVTKVVDGDTFEIESGERVRLIGIDTPETVDPRRPVGCFGYEASNVTKGLLEGKRVKMEGDLTDRDKYGRLLRYVWLDNLFVNEYLVREGFAQSSSYPPDVKYQGLFDAAEIEARESKRGLWGSCKL